MFIWGLFPRFFFNMDIMKTFLFDTFEQIFTWIYKFTSCNNEPYYTRDDSLYDSDLKLIFVWLSICARGWVLLHIRECETQHVNNLKGQLSIQKHTNIGYPRRCNDSSLLIVIFSLLLLIIDSFFHNHLRRSLIDVTISTG